MFQVGDWQQFHKARAAAGFSDEQCFSIALGNFDGMHIGHQRLIRQMIDDTKAVQGYGAVLSFSPHPLELLRGEAVPKILPLAAKEQAICHMGVDGYLLQRFDRSWAEMSAEDFVTEILIKGLGVNRVYVGFNHSFGHRGQGDAALLRKLAEAYGVAVIVMPPVEIGGEVVSSSTIRKNLAAGDMIKVTAMLGGPFTVEGEVVQGRQLGRAFGFPTANVIYPAELQPLRPGVYAVEAEINGVRYQAVANCGYQPTIDEHNKTMVLEVHILDGDMNLYGKTMKTYLLRQLRPETRFAGVDELKQQITRDKENARAFFARGC